MKFSQDNLKLHINIINTKRFVTHYYHINKKYKRNIKKICKRYYAERHLLGKCIKMNPLSFHLVPNMMRRSDVPCPVGVFTKLLCVASSYST